MTKVQTAPAHVIAFTKDGPPRTTRVDDPAIVDAPYEAKSWRAFTDASGRAISGIWEAGPHREHCDCDYDEMCHILEGEVRLTDADGAAQVFGPGDSFVVAAGFKGTWENLTPVRKVFFILSPAPQAASA